MKRQAPKIKPLRHGPGHRMRSYSLFDAEAAVGPGWAHVMHELWRHKPERLRVTLVKMKDGMLHMEFKGPPDALLIFGHWVVQAIAISRVTCERCGAPGKRHISRRRIQTLCNTCWRFGPPPRPATKRRKQ